MRSLILVVVSFGVGLLTALLLLLVLADELEGASPRYTLIVQARAVDGSLYAEPIYPVVLGLVPLNAVATAIGPGEALRCETSVSVVEHDDDIVYLTCDEARFQLRGFRMQE